MKKIVGGKTILRSLMGASLALSLMGLPVRANEQLQDLEFRNWNRTHKDWREVPSRNTEPADSVKNLVGITGLVIGTGIMGWHISRAYKPSVVNAISERSNKKTVLLDHVSPKLRRELLRLVNDQQTANRLLSGTLTSHPSRPVNWLAEKVIYDLKRDRG
ncbi:MAG: hypothetical protein QNJ65_01945 [Xenococcaceae cyanobacterium MO_234.B1]|nr:hypothetical protein [Xenococcaceae cyanobacterium MO_234.B1]